MTNLYFLTCYLLGVVAAAPVGPLGVLVFNRGARHGIGAGIATGLGAALADTMYCFLGLIGTLDMLKQHTWVMPWLYGIGSVALFAMGVLLIAHRVPAESSVKRVSRYSAMLSQGFMITALNPMVPLFFMTAGMQMLTGYRQPSIWQGVVGVLTGSSTVFMLAALVGHWFGKRVARARIAQLQLVTGIILLGVSALMLLRVFGFAQLFSW